MPIHKNINKDFFKIWSAEMAYVLGFFAADGSMLTNNRGAHFIEFHITDFEVIEIIQKALGSDHKISKRNLNNKWKTLYRLQIGSKEMFFDPESFGFTQAKSKKMRLPKIPKEFLADFVRGYFDGDGCIYFKKHNVKDRKKPKWIFSSRFTSGSRLFLADVHSALRGVVQKGYIATKKKGEEIHAYELVFSHRDSQSCIILFFI
ncbi:MAG: LAGLIDADG family homing endonuclease [Candidatus Paceibacterota bacterium]|jgi:intein-encoded DNA endonuclease-like protein